VPQPRSRILVVDDYEDWRAVLRALLEAHGFDVEEAENGREALEKLERMGDETALVLLDLMMPGMDGAEVIAELRRRQGDFGGFPVVVVTAASDAARARIADFRVLQKPVHAEVLLQVVQEAIAAAS